MTGKKSKHPTKRRTKAEWVSLIISLLLVSGVVCVVVALWLSPANRPTSFRVERSTIRHEENYYYLPIKVTNEGDATGAQVTVEGKLKSGSTEEAASTTFDFIPARSSAEGILIFTSDPTTAQVHVISYQQP
ncbi:MAG TPA: hypothetical protein VF553_16035 [Pyrinomonadaceae bacterium]|jgi:uncharacterized protein (TIGR02588 family)